MKFLVLFLFIVFTVAFSFDFFERDLCSSEDCTTSGETITSVCGDDGNTDYACMCNKMSDSFYDEILNCTRSCGSADDFQDWNSGTDVKEYYCKLASSASVSASGGSSTSSSRSSSSTTNSGSSSSSRGDATTEYYVSFVGIILAWFI